MASLKTRKAEVSTNRLKSSAFSGSTRALLVYKPNNNAGMDQRPSRPYCLALFRVENGKGRRDTRSGSYLLIRPQAGPSSDLKACTNGFRIAVCSLDPQKASVLQAYWPWSTPQSGPLSCCAGFIRAARTSNRLRGLHGESGLVVNLAACGMCH